jgi:hypothetical protein
MAGGSRKLAANVWVNGDLYLAGSSPEKAVADQISNPKAWGKGGDHATEGDAPAFPEGDPSEDWKASELKAYADSKEIDVSAAKNKTEVLAILGKA